MHLIIVGPDACLVVDGPEFQWNRRYVFQLIFLPSTSALRAFMYARPAYIIYALSKIGVRPSIRLFHALSSKRYVLELW